MDNLQKSEFVIARILSKFLENGIQPKYWSYEDFEFDDETYLGFCEQSLRWLKREGIISFEGYTELMGANFRLQNPCLTSLGFNILGTKMLIGQREEKIADIVQNVSKNDVSYSKVGDFFGGLLGGFTKSIGG